MTDCTILFCSIHLTLTYPLLCIHPAIRYSSKARFELEDGREEECVQRRGGCSCVGGRGSGSCFLQVREKKCERFVGGRPNVDME